MFNPTLLKDAISPVNKPVEGELNAKADQAVNQPVDPTTLTVGPDLETMPFCPLSPIPKECPKPTVKPSVYIIRLQNGKDTTHVLERQLARLLVQKYLLE
ncbi:hypothetical protein CPB83DRAFT_895792 [Crepidotus variabilis]|uniref:Uncharacterized protein n=1 Tax=Crepidotus variabilis TaxID=179855 RepID=A0A9P6EC86_9AGAR|nr:hypothetical protein CPB83DRAFT_895792 [Crepidotus variabilis]